MMIGGIYKKGQGYWTRLMTAIALGLIVLLGVVWMWDLLATVRVGFAQTVYVQAGAAVVVIAVFGWLGYYLVGLKPKVVDFMIATEGEMKKVSWSDRKELIGSTKVVIFFTALMATLLFMVDMIFMTFFNTIGVLRGASPMEVFFGK